MLLKPKQTAEDRIALDFWEKYYEDLQQEDGLVDLFEDPDDKLKRIKDLEANHEAWFKYYFPKYYSSQPMPFHNAISRLLMNRQWLAGVGFTKVILKPIFMRGLKGLYPIMLIVWFFN